MTNDYENIDFEDSLFATVCRPHLKSDYETASSFDVHTLPKGTTMHYAKYHDYLNTDVNTDYLNTDVEPTMELGEASNYEVPRSIYKDPGIDEKAIHQWFNTMRLQKISSKSITYVRTLIKFYIRICSCMFYK